MLHNIKSRLFQQISRLLGADVAFRDISIIKALMIEEYKRKRLFENPKYLNAKMVNLYEHTDFSQCGEDGIIHEIFHRIGTKHRTFVEIGCSNGFQNNTTRLLATGWRGVWIEQDKKRVDEIRVTFKEFIDNFRLKIQHEFVTKENIENIFIKSGVDTKFDLLSIDIDGNDYWIWKALQRYKPRVVVIEYNATFGSSLEWVIDYNPSYVWDGTNNHGASLKSLELLGKSLGYTLVACSFSGVNAFFVRDDLVKNCFLPPYTAEHFFEPPRHFLELHVGCNRNPKIFKDFHIR